MSIRNFLVVIVFYMTPCCVNAQGVSSAAKDQLISQYALIRQEVTGKIFPDFEFKKGQEKITRAGLTGKVVFINFWFESCPPCRAELKALDSLYNSLKDTADFEFVSLTFEDKPTIKWVQKKNKIGFPAYSINIEECERLTFGGGYPTNIILDKNGIVRYINAGGSTNKKEAMQYIMEKLRPEILKYL